MRTAPPVSVTCTGGFAWRALQALLPALATSALVAWLLGQLQSAVWPALLVLPVGALWVGQRIQPRPAVLAWDGAAWSVDGQPGQLQLMIDLGPWLLLRMRPYQRGDHPSAHSLPAPPATSRAAAWLAVSRADAGASMHALRAAVYCRASEPHPGHRPPPAGHGMEKPD